MTFGLFDAVKVSDAVPMKRELKVKWCQRASDTWSVSDAVPMKRELKCGIISINGVEVTQGFRRCPYEEGTERSTATRENVLKRRFQTLSL